MPEESTTPDLVELARRSFQPGMRRDWGAAMAFWGPACVWDMSPMGMGVHEGPAAIRGFFEDWLAAYDEFEMEAEEVLTFGNEITFIVFRQDARLSGSHARVQFRHATVSAWAEGLIVRATNYPDIDEGRAAAEHLAAERE
jgi:hypothetical protein